MDDEFNFVEEDFSDLEIPREMVTKEELAQDPEVQKVGKKISKSRVILAVGALLILIVGTCFLFQVSAQRAAYNESQEQSQSVY